MESIIKENVIKINVESNKVCVINLTNFLNFLNYVNINHFWKIKKKMKMLMTKISSILWEGGLNEGDA